MRCPAAVAVIPLGAGIAAGIFLPITFPPALLVCLWLAAVSAFLRNNNAAVIAIVVFSFFCAGIALGHSADSASRNRPIRGLFDRHVTPAGRDIFGHVDGRLRRDAVRGPSGVTLDVRVERIVLDGEAYSTSGGALIGVAGELKSDQYLQWRAGRRVILPATLRAPTRYLDPGVPDGERQLAWRGTSLVGSVKSEKLVDIVARGGVASEAFAAVRACVRRSVRSTVGVWSERSAAIVLAILIGDRAGLTDEIERRLQEAGTYHVIAISGGNIAIFAGLCVFLCRMCRVGPRTSALLVIGMLGAYALAVEGGSSVGRATLMAVIYFAAGMWDHRTAPLNAVALTGALVLCANPLQVADAGFLLTFGATLGIVAGMSKLAAASALFERARWAIALAAASASAEISLLPVNAFVFSRVTFAGLVVNFAAVPLMAIVQIAGMAAVAASLLVPQVAPTIGWFAHLGVEGLVGSSVLVDWMPWLTRRLAPPPMWVVGLYYAALVTLAVPAGRIAAATASRWTIRPGAAIVLAACGIWIVAAPGCGSSTADGVLRVTVLDVGQGDSSIAQFPDGRTLSIDAGGAAASSFDIGARVVSPAFWALGVRRLDYMTITHGDVDHIGGAASLFRDFRPFEVWEGVPVPPHLPTRELRALADTAGTPWRTLQPPDRTSFGKVDLLVHHPPHPDWERQRVRNDDSAVLEVRYGDVSFVFTGDISRDVERTIAPGFGRAAIRILKVPHHGSATSSSQLFLDALRPDIAVISAGRGNPFGHPVPAVLDRYRDIGAAIYRTDQDGAITVETDGTTVRTTTFTGRRLTLTTHGR